MKIKTLSLVFTLFCFSASSQTIVHKYYTIYYDSIMHGPDYTEYWLTKNKLKQVTNRPPTFYPDTSIDKKFQATNKLYVKSIFDKGHLSPADDFRFNKDAEHESMYLTNIAPQMPRFNRGTWKALEAYTRRLTKQYDSIEVFTGVIYGDKKLSKGTTFEEIPTYYWKVLMYSGIKEFYVGKNETPKTKDINSMKVTEDEFIKMTNLIL